MTLREVINSQEALQVLIDRDDIESTVSFRISKAALAVKPDVQLYYETRKSLIKKYGKHEPEQKDEKKGTFKAEDWAVEAGSEGHYKYTEENEKLLDQKVNVKVETIDHKEFEGLKIKPKIFYILNWLIK